MSNRTRTYIGLIVCIFGALVIGCAPTARPATPAPISITASATSPPGTGGNTALTRRARNDQDVSSV